MFYIRYTYIVLFKLQQKLYRVGRISPHLYICTGCILRSQSSYRSLRWIGNPSSNHCIEGGGLPLAIHLRETDGPGCNVCSENLYNSAGIASETQKT